MRTILKKLPAYFLLLSTVITLYGFYEVWTTEARLLDSPKEAIVTENKTVPQEIKGTTFYITQEDADLYNTEKQCLYTGFIVTVVLAGLAWVTKSKIK